jgi:serine/threonine protein kinase
MLSSAQPRRAIPYSLNSLLACQPEAENFIESPALELAAKALAQDQMKAPPRDLVGTTIAHYFIEEKIGAGGMGVVYKARDTHLERNVAIKVLPVEAVADLERKRRFVQEAKSASALNHPNIIHIYDIDSADGSDFIAMEYVAGKALNQLIGRNGLQIGEALKYAVQIADALAAAHDAGIVHRDLKPANIMVTEKGLVKVLDFGLAKLIETSQGDTTATTHTIEPLTEEGRIIGTVAYMSPEQAEGRKVDTRSDIFSFGSVLYEMLTGSRAFQGSSKIGILSSVLHQEPKPIEGVPPEWGNLFGLRRVQDRQPVPTRLLTVNGWPSATREPSKSTFSSSGRTVRASARSRMTLLTIVSRAGRPTASASHFFPIG